MRLLIDECLSIRVAEALKQIGHDAAHVADLSLLGAGDDAVVEAANHHRRVLVSADTDFGEIFVRSEVSLPSLILLRRRDHTPEGQAAVIASIVSEIFDDLEAGAIAVIEESRVRIRRLVPEG